MSKLCVIRGGKAILNIHERSFPVPATVLSGVLDSLAGHEDHL